MAKEEKKEGNLICLFILLLKYLYSESDSSYYFWGFLMCLCVYKVLSITEGVKLDKSGVYHVYVKNIVRSE